MKQPTWMKKGTAIAFTYFTAFSLVIIPFAFLMLYAITFSYAWNNWAIKVVYYLMFIWWFIISFVVMPMFLYKGLEIAKVGK